MSWTPTEISMLVSLAAGSLAVVLHAVQRSRCTEVKCGCIQCIRHVPPQQDDDAPRPPTIANLAPDDLGSQI